MNINHHGYIWGRSADWRKLTLTKNVKLISRTQVSINSNFFSHNSLYFLPPMLEPQFLKFIMNHIDWFSLLGSSSCSFPRLPFLPWKGKTKATGRAHSEWEGPIMPCWCKHWEQTDWLPQNWPCSLQTWCSNQETKSHQTRSCLHKGNHRQHSRADKTSRKLEERSPCDCWKEASEFTSQSGHCADHWGSIADAIPY